jgi:hypothetical protein
MAGWLGLGVKIFTSPVVEVGFIHKYFFNKGSSMNSKIIY